MEKECRNQRQEETSTRSCLLMISFRRKKSIGDCFLLILCERESKMNLRIDFGIHSGEEIMKMAVVDVHRDDMYAHIPTAPGLPPIRRAADHGPLDLRLGTTEKSAICATCNEPLATCSGHFGYIRFTLPIFHQVHISTGCFASCI